MSQFVKTLFATFSASALCLALASPNVYAGEILPLAVDLKKDAQTAQQHQVPIVLFFTATWCGYCKKLEENILNPLFERTDLESYGEFRQVVMDKSHWMMKDLNGQAIEMKTLGPALKIKVAPTTLFLNAQGQQIAEPIVGLTLEEFYPGNLEKSLNQALSALGNPKRVDIYKMVEDAEFKPKL
jgi:thiol:disulfide interchange protein